MEKGLNLFQKQRAKTYQIIIICFLLLILVGTILLCLPIASSNHTFTSFFDALFTAVSASCVTGLVVKDTATHWSMFGQFIILIMIQIGGMGVITIALAIFSITGKKIGMMERTTMQESVGAPRARGIIRLTGFIIKTSLIIEAIGAILLFPQFFKDFGLLKGIWYSIFHSVSAFCNAGFDLMGIRSQFSSFISYNDNLLVNVVIMLLIIIGGIGFLTWDDLKTNKLKFKSYSLQTKIILITSLILIFVPSIYFFAFEYRGVRLSERIIMSLFQSITCRTAGFNTSNIAAMDDSGAFIMIILMLIGGCPGSTAGGMKTTTIAVLFLAAISVYQRKKEVQTYNRRLSDETIRGAGAILFMYLTVFILSAIIISRVEDLPLLPCLFESASAIGTVGLTFGITPTLGAISRIILMILMFIGRVGGLTLIYAAVPDDTSLLSKPLERISVG